MFILGTLHYHDWPWPHLHAALYIVRLLLIVRTIYNYVKIYLVKYIVESMSKENQDNGKTANKEVHRNNKKRELYLNGDSKGWYQEASSIETNNSLSFSRDDWARGDNASATGGTVSGGILKQFIRETDDQLNESVARVKKLQERKQQLIELFRQLSEKTGESWENVDVSPKPANDLDSDE
ncbi:MAG: hypothetical protein AAGJ08_01795 [Cyanobacteria bacterium P01_H01_bin.35]